MIKSCNFMVIFIFILIMLSGCFPSGDQEKQIMEEQNYSERIYTAADKENDNDALPNTNKHDLELNYLKNFNEALNTHRGKGFSIQYPANAIVRESSDNEIEIVGPNVSYRFLEGSAVISGPLYSLRIKTFSNPYHLTAEEWAREYIISTWQEAKKHGEVPTSLPVTGGGEIIEDRVKEVTIANQPVFRVDGLEPDSIPIYYYFSNNEQIVVINFYDTTMPLRLAAQDIYSLIINTFRFSEL